MKRIHFLLVILIVGLPILNIAFADNQSMKISDISILISPSIKAPVNTTLAKMLEEEIEKRASVECQETKNWKVKQNAIVAICLSNDKKLAGQRIPMPIGSDLPETMPEGYRLFTEQKNGKNIIWIIGADARGALFGVGYFLRKAVFTTKSIEFSHPHDMATAPQQSVRGHQLGYRNTANSYDAWNVDQYEQYIRELVIFGSNAIENIPFEGGPASPHMPISREEMNVRLSEICEAYDVDYWVWTPATFDLTDTEKRKALLNQHEELYRKCPKLDQIFFPGGDPGHNHPRHVMPFLKDMSKILTCPRFLQNIIHRPVFGFPCRDSVPSRLIIFIITWKHISPTG
jgi:hypothetical protein